MTREITSNPPSLTHFQGSHQPSIKKKNNFISSYMDYANPFRLNFGAAEKGGDHKADQLFTQT